MNLIEVYKEVKEKGVTERQTYKDRVILSDGRRSDFSVGHDANYAAPHIHMHFGMDYPVDSTIRDLWEHLPGLPGWNRAEHKAIWSRDVFLEEDSRILAFLPITIAHGASSMDPARPRIDYDVAREMRWSASTRKYHGIYISSKPFRTEITATGNYMKYADELARSLGAKPGQRPKEEKHQLLKRYWLFGWTRRIEDLKRITRELAGINPGIVYGRPLITPEQAYEMLKEEIELTDSLFDGPLIVGPVRDYSKRGPMIRRLAVEHFGTEVVKPMAKLKPAEYLEFLCQRGYEYDGMSEKKEEFPNDRRIKERYLFDFFRQSFGKNPDRSVKKFMNFYKNKGPEPKLEPEICAETGQALPTNAQIYSFDLEQRRNSTGKQSPNSIFLGKLEPSDRIPGVTFYIDIGAPDFLPAQNYLCWKLGISFAEQ